MPETFNVDGEKSTSLDDDSFKNELPSTEGHIGIAAEISETKENPKTERSSYGEHGPKRDHAKSVSRGNLRRMDSIKMRKLPSHLNSQGNPQSTLSPDGETVPKLFADETSETDEENDGSEIKNDEMRPRFDLLRM
eukprot:10695230-Ditylum_brightwellii.AAC.1